MATEAQRVEVTRTPLTAGKAVLLGGAVLLTVLLETIARGSVRLPGHRAFPGALAILLFAGMFRTWTLMAFALVVPDLLVLLGVGDAHGGLLFVAWLATAGAAAAAARNKQPGALSCLFVGALFGLLRWGSLLFGAHHTPQLVRFTGHVLFGLLAGAVAWAATRRSSTT
jgi:hypothetical protein